MPTATDSPASAPPRSLTQRREALDRANVVRQTRAAFKKRVKARQASIGPVLADPPEWARTMKVLDLLLAAPKTGKVKASKILAECRISPTRTLAGLSQRQREDLDRLLRRG